MTVMFLTVHGVNYTIMHFLAGRGCLISSFAIVIKFIQGSLIISFSTSCNMNLFSHIVDFSVINKKFIYRWGIHPLVHSKVRSACNTSWNFNSLGSIKFLLLLVFNFIYFTQVGYGVKDKWKSYYIFKTLPQCNLEQCRSLCTQIAVSGKKFLFS